MTQTLKGCRYSKRKLMILENTRSRTRKRTWPNIRVLLWSPIYFKKCLNNYLNTRRCVNSLGGPELEPFGPNSELEFGFAACLIDIKNYASKTLQNFVRLHETSRDLERLHRTSWDFKRLHEISRPMSLLSFPCVTLSWVSAQSVVLALNLSQVPVLNIIPFIWR
jgi:hypothetical protein